MNKDSVIMDRKASTPQPVVGQKKVDNREKPRLAQGANIDAEKLLEWFDYAGGGRRVARRSSTPRRSQNRA
jgi:hypothetical protein